MVNTKHEEYSTEIGGKILLFYCVENTGGMFFSGISPDKFRSWYRVSVRAKVRVVSALNIKYDIVEEFWNHSRATKHPPNLVQKL